MEPLIDYVNLLFYVMKVGRIWICIIFIGLMMLPTGKYKVKLIILLRI